MPKRLVALTLSLLLCGGVIATTATAQPPNPPTPRAQPGRDAPDRMAERRGQRCENIHALTAARLAYLEARLDLTGAQVPAFARWRDIRLAAAKRRADACAAMPGPQAGRGVPPGPVERLTREEERLQQRLADIRTERPVLDALTNALSPDQRQTLARTALAGGPGLPMQGGMMNRRGDQRGNMMFQRTPDGNMMFRRGGRGDMPPPDGPPPPR